MLIEKLKENRYQIPMAIAIILFMIFAFNNQRPYTSKDIKLDSISHYYSEKVNSLDSTHKSSLEALKTTYKLNIEIKENEIIEKSSKISDLSISISRYRKELEKSKNQFIYIQDGEVRFNDFFAKGKKVVYKKGEFEKLLQTNDKTDKLKSTIETLNSITKSLRESIEVYKTDSTYFVSTIDSISKSKTQIVEHIIEVDKEIHIENMKGYNVSICLDTRYDDGFTVDGNLVLDARKYLLTIPLIKSRLYINAGYMNKGIINPYANHILKAGIGVEF